MKKVFLFLVVMLPIISNAQDSTVISIVGGNSLLYNGSGFSIDEINPYGDCGTWESLPPDTTEWKTIDTLHGGSFYNKEKKWVYSNLESVSSNIMVAVFAPCGLGTPSQSFQYRIDTNSGIRQKRYITTYNKYIPKPKTDYEKAIEKFK